MTRSSNAGRRRGSSIPTKSLGGRKCSKQDEDQGNLKHTVRAPLLNRFHIIRCGLCIEGLCIDLWCIEIIVRVQCRITAAGFHVHRDLRLIRLVQTECEDVVVEQRKVVRGHVEVGVRESNEHGPIHD